MQWEFDPSKYVEKEVTEEEEIAVYEEPEEEYQFSDDDWPPLPRSRNNNSWGTRTKMTPDEKISKVIECLVSGIDDKDAYMTREEIGLYFQYAKPVDSIAVMHQAHSKILDRLSERRETLDSRRCIREKVFYSPDGVYEIACYSKQQKSSDFFREFLKALKQKAGAGGVDKTHSTSAL